jgi:hypothetical protein
MAKGLGVIGLGLSIGGGIFGAIQESRAAKTRANIAQQNARIAQQNAAFQAEQQRKETQRRLGSQRAAFGAGGLVTTEGSPLLVNLEQALEGEIEAQNILRQGQLDADRFRLEAESENTSPLGGILGAVGGGILTGQSLLK